MDHKWGRGVMEWGLGGVGATLASRLWQLPGVWIQTNYKPSLGTCRRFVLAPDMGGNLRWVGFDVPDFTGRFPHGYAVLPDGPV